MLAAEVEAWADGGGKAPAARRPLAGRAEVLRHLLALTANSARIRLTPEVVNGEAAVVTYLDGRLAGVTVVEFENDHIVAIRTVANPDKLAFLQKQKG
jgi:RNA polymerase sigma-70 factor (ECF subfamily)